MLIRIQDIIDRLTTNGQDIEYAHDYILFREIEDWCHEYIPRDKWRFDYSSTICVTGVDIPGHIFFWSDEDATAFRLRFIY
jgi:hypothetical protein